MTTRRTSLAAWLLAALSLQACAGAAAPPKAAPMFGADQFAQAVGAAGAPVSSFGSLPLPSLGPDALLAWGVVTVDGDPRPHAVLRGRCPGSAPCAPKALRLPLGAEVSMLALLDRQGAAFSLNLLQPPADPAAVQTPASAAQPAALLQVRQTLPGELRRSTLVLVALDGPAPVALWREIDSSLARDGGGYRSHRLDLKPGEGGWLSLELGQTTLPGAGTQPQQPGPPLALRFVFDGQSYQRRR